MDTTDEMTAEERAFRVKERTGMALAQAWLDYADGTGTYEQVLDAEADALWAEMEWDLWQDLRV